MCSVFFLIRGTTSFILSFAAKSLCMFYKSLCRWLTLIESDWEPSTGYKIFFEEMNFYYDPSSIYPEALLLWTEIVLWSWVWLVFLLWKVWGGRDLSSSYLSSFSNFAQTSLFRLRLILWRCSSDFSNCSCFFWTAIISSTTNPNIV